MGYLLLLCVASQAAFAQYPIPRGSLKELAASAEALSLAVQVPELPVTGREAAAWHHAYVGVFVRCVHFSATPLGSLQEIVPSSCALKYRRAKLEFSSVQAILNPWRSSRPTIDQVINRTGKAYEPLRAIPVR